MGNASKAEQETARVRRQYDRQASGYDQGIAVSERWFFKGGREWVASQAKGEVLELAIGTGRNLSYYPPDVVLTGIELSPAMLAIARQRAQTLGRAIDLQVGDVEMLPFPDGRFDTVVCTLALCTIPHPRQALQEAWRVLRPGGHLLLLEHVRSPAWSVRALQYVLEPLSVRFGADHLLREPLEDAQAVGFQIEQLERSSWGVSERLVAVKP
jgi:ubiquinone/menaquinone biosynthesis C-methylase UbiE